MRIQLQPQVETTSLPYSIAFCIAATSIALAAPPDDPGLIGRWTGETFANGSPARMTIEFFPNGTYERHIETITELGWSLAGEILLIAPAIGVANGEITYGKAAEVRVTLSGDDMTQSAGGKSIRMTRLTSLVPDNPVVGRWNGRSEENDEVFQEFLPDGRLLVTLLTSGELGKWSVDGSTIKWEEQVPTPRRKKSNFKMKDGKLLVYIAPRIPPMEMTKVEPAAASR